MFDVRAWLVTFALVSAACPGSHTDLGVDTGGSTGSTTSQGGFGGANGGAGGTAASGAGGDVGPVEPDGPAVLTIVNGVVDRAAIQLCFAESPASLSDTSEPWPAGALDFARATTLTLPGAPIPAAAEIEIAALAGDLASLAGRTCREILDDPASVEGVDIASLGVLPASFLDEPRHLVIGVSGCIGPAPMQPAEAEAHCGVGALPQTPFPTISVGTLSRLTDAGAPAIQVVNFSSAGRFDAFLKGALDQATEKTIAAKIVFGQAAPFPPYALDVEALGSIPGSTFRAGVPNTAAGASRTLAEAMLNGALSTGDFGAGKNVAIIAVGVSPALAAPGPGMNPFSIVGVRATQ